MNQSFEKPVAVACFACGKTQRVRPSKITRCDAYLCASSCCASLMPDPLEGFFREFHYEAAGGLGGYVLRAATEQEQEAARSAKKLAAAVRDLPSADYLTRKQLSERGWTGWLFKQLLPTPDVVWQDPALPRKVHRLYRRDRVERAESTREWQQVQKEVLGRKEWEAKQQRWGQRHFLGSEDWMACDHAEGMLAFLDRRGLGNGRADELLACALARGILCSIHADLLDEELQVAERHAEGLAAYGEYMAASGSALRKVEEEYEADADEEDDGWWGAVNHYPAHKLRG